MAKKHTLTIEEKLQQALVPKEEQPYEIPDNWCWVRLNSVADIFTGNSINAKEKTSKYTNLLEGYNYIATKDVGFNSDINYDNGIKIPFDTKLRIAKKGSTLLCIEGGSAGKKYGFLKEDVCFVNKLCAFYPRFFNPKYLFYFLQSPCFSIEFKQQMNGLIGGVSLNKLKNMVMVLIPLEEQQKLVDKIDFLFTKLDKAKDFIQATIDKFEQNKMAVLHKAFTGELTATWRKSHGIVQPIEYISLNDCGTWSGGGTPSTSHQEYWENGNILWITSKDMKVKYITSSQKMVNEYGIEHSSAKYIEKPALLFVIRSGILRNTLPVCMVQKPFTINQDLKALIPKDGIELAYVYWICKSQEFTILNTCMKNGTTVESISFDKLKDFKIPIPDIEEQREVVRILDDVITKEQHIMELATKNLTQIELLKKSILAKAFRGGLGTNDGDDGSAMELLKSILANEE